MSYPIGRDWTVLPKVCKCGLDLMADARPATEFYRHEMGHYSRVWACPTVVRARPLWSFWMSEREVRGDGTHLFYWNDADITRWWKRA